MQQIKLGLKWTINWNKYQLEVSIERQNQYLPYLIDLSLRGVNRIFVLLSENNNKRKAHTGYSLPKLEIKTMMLWSTIWSASQKWSKNVWQN